MNFTRFLTTAALFAASAALLAQSSSSSLTLVDSDSDVLPGAGRAPAPAYAPVRPLSKVGFGVGVSPLGIQLGMSTSLNAHMNIRASGNFFNYSTNFTASGIAANARLNLKSAGAALDLYPFHAGFRISPGLLLYSGNELTANANVPGGTSFTLNGQTYYSANTNTATGATPVTGNALLNLHKSSPAFTITTGWGNALPRKGHLSFPFEVGVALVGAPAVNVNLGGWACYDQAQTLCTDITSKTDPIALQIQGNLHSQVDKWARDVEPLKTYPIASFGVAYSFNVGSNKR